MPARDSAMAAWKRFVGAALKAVRKNAIEVAPALPPPRVTCPGSPPNCRKLLKYVQFEKI